MATREEIREGIENVISNKGYYFPYAETTQDILRYLHSQGVVIKVDRELPFADPYLGSRLNYRIDLMSPAHGSVMEVYRIAQQDMGEAGYVAVEPVIGE